jgi:Phage integrase, N-terminal SAM-like domain
MCSNKLYMAEGRGLLEVAREKMRTRRFAYRTEKAHLNWIRRYVKFHQQRHPRAMGAAEIESFLTHLAVDSQVGANRDSQGWPHSAGQLPYVRTLLCHSHAGRGIRHPNGSGIAGPR